MAKNETANTALAKIEKASVKRILKDIVGTQPELIRDAIIAGLLAPPPRSFPYLMLAVSYCDGKAVDSDSSIHTTKSEDLSELSKDQLLARALNLARRMQKAEQEQTLKVIDVTPEAK